MRLRSRVRVNLSICLLICSQCSWLPSGPLAKIPSTTENQEQNPRARPRDNPCNHKVRLLTHPTSSARASPGTSQNLGYSFLRSWGNRSYIQASHKGLWRSPMLPSNWLCGVSMLETLSLVSHRGTGLPKGQSLVESKSFSQALTRPEACKALPHQPETPDHTLASSLLRLAWCPWPWICSTLILRAQRLPGGEQEGSLPYCRWTGPGELLNMPRQAQPRPMRPLLGCDFCLAACSLGNFPSRKRSCESSRIGRSPFP